ncbi:MULTISPECIES: hypothetical protein [Rhizobium]|uniref:Uncharacterized protein n=1 Tax=Rhizobium rhododendri TaxID=2506430 RepID=A0ABY8IN64_9HYPH|nr:MULTISPECIES: hypothetical protein [Rhizobium]MBO9132481.1 hypothetical protein [Rhizobium sp. B209b/85]MBO9098714.1 hypothetical protein [Rhizobium sp. L58/93]MBO9168980.1 hypothetical protein [Rhizobium sp. L245/93]MBO9184930.1 hypothetical protein [Rhizobium sp. E27B/91]MBZ5758343.1 hypothetical protein [Rhizobium sp. VS19-DR96]
MAFKRLISNKAITKVLAATAAVGSFCRTALPFLETVGMKAGTRRQWPAAEMDGL